ncbi:NAD+ synthase [Pedobacter flavus]|uniref:Glutamine-dependent NAD(+) synthetase n=1 Tax=Pedobacter flavus TaxID=3113906 RepID=A0ABU7H0I7_9SPHI|nr:NAD+ synthase [Pedobacter sp. VNH31]MEE1884848.1 NAD+ synthase [Pedobacter sp. VNH31]
MKIALAQLNYHIGNFELNTQKNISYLQQAKAEGADLVVFSELSICGYSPQDLLDYSSFMEACEHALSTIAEHCDSIACIIGMPIKNEVLDGKDFYNVAHFIENKKIKATVKKALLPTYDVFDEYRYFEPGETFKCIEFKGKKIALTICEDLWNINDNPMYVSCPMDTLIKESPDLMINIAASPFSYCHDEERKSILSDNCKKYNLPLFYVNAVGAQTEIVFDGGSLVFNNDGAIMAEMPYFKEALGVFDVEELEISATFPPQIIAESDISQIHKALIVGIQDYFSKSGFKKAVLGLSGGIDSAIVCALAAEALGPEHVHAILMPSKYSSDHSIKDAIDLVQNLGCLHQIIPIEKASEAFEISLADSFRGLAPNLTEENIQARCRGIILMALSNKFGYILLNTSNKSEVSVGYGTLYGDMCGAMGVIGDVYKTQVFELAKYINRDREIIPINTIVKPPSAELRPDQKDSDSLPEYDLLDKLLMAHIEHKKDRKQLIEMGFDKDLVARILKLVNIAEFKRFQAPPILRVSPKAYGMGRRVPIVSKYI